MSKVLVRAALYRPTAPGDIPANGYIEARPSLRRELDDLDQVILPAKSRSRLGAALTYTDNSDDEQTAPATPGVVWFWIDPTDAGDYANLWFWTFTERTDGGTRRYVVVPTSGSTLDYEELVDINPADYEPSTPPTPGWTAALAAEAALARNASNLTSGTVPDARIPSGITRDSELTAAVAAEATARDVAIAAAINALLDGAPGALDTLNELAAAINDDASFAASVTTALAGKATAADLTTEATNRANADTALDARLDTLELDTAPGKELGYAERTTSATSTATSVAAAAAISGLSVTVTGKGRPVDIEFYCASITHSTANTTVNVGVLCNGNVLGPGTQYGATASASTTAGQGRSLCIKRRMVLTDGVSYTFTVRAFALGVSGTSTLYAVADYEPLYLAITAR